MSRSLTNRRGYSGQGTIRRGRWSVTTWADGYGRWYAAVSGEAPDPRRVAREAIRRELSNHEMIGPGFRLTIQPAPDQWLTTTREARPVFRERIEK